MGEGESLFLSVTGSGSVWLFPACISAAAQEGDFYGVVSEPGLCYLYNSRMWCLLGPL